MEKKNPNYEYLVPKVEKKDKKNRRKTLYETAPRMPVRVVRSTPFYEQPWDETDEYLFDEEEEDW